MGLLDDLEQEAQRRKAGLGDVERLKQDRETAYKTILDPGMQALYAYLTKLTGNLAYLKPKKQLRYEIPGYGVVVGNIDHDYDLKISSQTTAKEITLNFTCVVAPEECPTVEVLGAPKVKALNAMFQKYRLAGLQEGKKDESGEMISATFRARGKIPLGVVVSADAESAQVRMNFTNFDSVGTVSKSVASTQFNEQLFDEIGRFIARDESSLFREALPDDYRRQLQQKVQQDQLRRKWEEKIAEQQRQELEQLKRDQGLKGKVERTMQAAKDKAPGLLDKMKGFFKKPS